MAADAVGCQRGVSPVVVSVSVGVSAAATLRNASARVKVSPMAWLASCAWYAWYRAISQGCPRGASDPGAGSGTGFHYPVCRRPDWAGRAR